MQVKLRVHFISYLHQLDSGILTESCFQLFRGWALGRLVICIRYQLPSVPSCSDITSWFLLTQNKLTAVQQSSCYS